MSCSLIDDEPKIRRFLRAGFELHGFTVLEAESAADGLKAATFNAPDLIILDLALPDLHGTEVLERLRSWSNVPIIILSVVSDEDEKVRLLQAGADDYVVKAVRHGRTAARAAEAALRRYFKSPQPRIRRGGRSSFSRSRRSNCIAQQKTDQIDLGRNIACFMFWRRKRRPRGHPRPPAQGDMEWQPARQYPVSSNPRSKITAENRNRSQPPAPSRHRIGCRLSSSGSLRR